MSGGNKIIGLRRDASSSAGHATPSDDELLLQEYYSSEFTVEEETPPSRWPDVARALLVASAAIWVIFNLWVLFGRGEPLPSLDAAPAAIAALAVPLVLIGTIYLLLVRSSRGESRRFARTADVLRKESDALERKLSHIGTQLTNAKAAMQEQASALENFGAAASANMEASARLIAASAAQAADHTVNAEKAGAELAEQITELVRSLPALEERASGMSAQLLESSQAMTSRIDSLERRLQAVMAISDDARLRTLSATKSLTTQLAQLQEETRSASDEINGMAEQAAGRIETAFTQARTALEETGTGLEGHATSLNALIGQARTSLADMGGEAVAGFQNHSQAIDARMQELNRLIETHGTLAARLGDELQDRLGTLETRFGDLEREGLARNERLAATIATVTAEAERMDQALASGQGTAEQLMARAESLLATLAASVREMEENYPVAVGKLDSRIEDTRKLLSATGPELERLGAAAQAVLDRAQETGSLVQEQARHLDGWMAETEQSLAARRTEIEELTTRIGADLLDRLGTLETRFADLEREGLVRNERLAATIATVAAEAERMDLAFTSGHGTAEQLMTRAEGLLAALTASVREMEEAFPEALGRMDGRIENTRALLSSAGPELEKLDSAAQAVLGRAQETGGLVQEQVRHLGEWLAETERGLATSRGEVEQLAARLGDDLANRIGMLETRFADLERVGLAGNERLTATIGTIAAEAERMNHALTSGHDTAEQMVARAESLLGALASSVRAIEENYPAALDRLDGRIGDTRRLLSETEPELGKLDTAAQSLLGRTQETGSLLQEQAHHLTSWLAEAESGLAASRGEIEQLRTALQEADLGANRLKESAGAQLVTTLVRVRETAEQATERVRQALARAIPDAAQSLGEASEEALRKAVSEQVTTQIAKMTNIANQAVSATAAASERLTERISAFSEASAAIEQRLDHADKAIAAQERSSYAHLSSQLIDSLNSLAIDVAKVLSSDVTDNDWSAYLKGDRGVFTRHAVRLLNVGEAREIALQYDSNVEFQDHVNRYIHDFESMLRLILSARDGNALAIALLSSDVGKLYVALAQAIDRLR